MSHWTVAKVKLVSIDPEVLDAAVKRLAEWLRKNGLPVVSEPVKGGVVKGWGVEEKVDYLIPARLPYGNGVGIKIEDGELRVELDEHGSPIPASRIAERLRQYYIAEAVKRAAEEHGWGYVEEEVGDTINVTVYT